MGFCLLQMNKPEVTSMLVAKTFPPLKPSRLQKFDKKAIVYFKPCCKDPCT